MKYDIDISDDDFWEIDAKIKISIFDDDQAIISCNKQGFLSLAKLFVLYAQDDVKQGDHLHIDEMTGLEDGSCELVVERIDNFE